jgi:hypothetical protein
MCICKVSNQHQNQLCFGPEVWFVHLKPSLMTASARAVHALNLPDISLQETMWRHGTDKPEVCWGDV